MSRCVLEISDLALSLADAGGLRQVSPAVAVAAGERLEVGEPARLRARLNPSRSSDRFWAQLDQQPLPRPLGSARSHADLAWFHLRALWQEAGRPDDEVLLAVPPDWDRQQLALLLGIARASDLPVVGLLAAPVAAAHAVGGDALILDAQLQSLRLTRLEVAAEVALGDSFAAARRGIAGLYDRWAGLIAERFLHETRFDPLHRASSEQALYAQLPTWLQRLVEQPSASLQLQVEQRQYRIEIARHSLLDAVREDYDAVLAAVRAQAAGELLVSHRAAQLPGLVAHLRAAGLPVVVLPENAVAQGALAQFERIRSDPEAPLFVTRLPRVTAPTTAAVAPLPVRPTHVLQGWQAIALAAPVALADSLQLVPEMDQVRLRAAGGEVRVNGRPAAAESPVWAGDEIELADGRRWLLISVAAEAG